MDWTGTEGDGSQMDVVRKRSAIHMPVVGLAAQWISTHEFIGMSRTDLMARFVTRLVSSGEMSRAPLLDVSDHFPRLSPNNVVSDRNTYAPYTSEASRASCAN